MKRSAASGCGIQRIDRNEEVTKVSRVIKRVARAGIAVAVLCGVAACASGPTKSDSQEQADKVMAERVEAALNADKALFAKHITAHADNGVVRLTGYVWEPTDFEEANYIASNVPGVTKVVNDLELNRNGNDNGPVAR
jgi:osmotically-inducible protein OsmY